MPLTLDRAPMCEPLVVLGCAPDLPGRARLAELGLRPGAPVQVLMRTAGRGRLVDIAGARLALGAQVARAVQVAPVHAEADS